MNKTYCYALTHPQKRIWYTEKLYENTNMFNIGGAILFEGSINIKLLEKSILSVIKKHEVFKIRLKEEDGNIFQYIGKEEFISVDFFDFSKKNEPQRAYEYWFDQEFKKPFSIYKEALFKFAIFKINENKYGYLLKFHHIIIDGWSINIITDDIYAFYKKYKKGEDTTYEEISSGSYLEYLNEEKAYKNSSKFNVDKIFWKERFKTIPELLFPPTRQTEGLRKEYTLNTIYSNAIKNFCEQNFFTVPLFFISCLSLMYFRYYQKTEVTFGIPILNRDRKKKEVVGMYICIMPLKLAFDTNMSLLEFCNYVYKEYKKSLLHYKYSYDLLYNDLEIRQKGYDRLYDISFNYYNSRLATRIDGIGISNEEVYCGNQSYIMQLLIKEWSDDGTISIYMDCLKTFFKPQTIDKLYKCLNVIMRQVVLSSELKLSDLRLLNNDEWNDQIYLFNQTDKIYTGPLTVDTLFKDRIKNIESRIALSSDDTVLSYAETYDKINQLAAIIQEYTNGKRVVIAVLANNTIESYITIWAIIFAGAIFLPIDSAYPQDRIDFILKDSKAYLLLTDKEIYSNGITVIPIGSIINKNVNVNYFVTANNNPDDIAYIIYTSGSTGEPKGVMVSHSNLFNYVMWAGNTYVKSDKEVFAYYSSIAFDLTITSLFVPFVKGIECRAYPKTNQEYVINNILRENRVSMLKLTPSHLKIIKSSEIENKSIKTLIVGGENLTNNLAAAISAKYEGIEIYNEYGPTEATVGCIVHKYNPLFDKAYSVPIGKPGFNMKAYVLSANLYPLPMGTTGELYIGGKCVTMGYLGKKAMTKLQFIVNPFVENEILYKTGDLVAFNNMGELVYLGRNDHQIKIQGYRVELEEIENYLLSIKSVNDVVVVPVGKEDPQLYAYIVADKKIDLPHLKKQLNKRFPSYMLPSQYILLDKINLTENGKIDRFALNQIKPIFNKKKDDIDRNSTASQIVLQQLASLLEYKRVSLNANFFEIGGDSIKAIQLSHKLKKYGYDLSIADILNAQSISDIIKKVYMSKTELSENKLQGSFSPTPIIKWFIEQEHQFPSHYNQSIIIKLNPRFSNDNVTKAFKILLKKHFSLRLNFDWDKKELFYGDQSIINAFELRIYDLTNISDKKGNIHQIQTELSNSFIFKKKQLFDASLFVLSEYKQLFITLHHLLTDSISWRILLDDFEQILTNTDAYNEEQSIGMTDGAMYKQWAEYLKEQGYDLFKGEENFWKKMNEKKIEKKKIANKKDIRKNTTCKQLLFSKESTNRLFNLSHNAFNTQKDELLKIAFLLTLRKFNHTEHVVCMIEENGRVWQNKNMDVSSTLGWFTAIYPLYVNLKNEYSFNTLMEHAKESIRQIPNGGIGYGVLRYLSDKLSRKHPDYFYNYLGDIVESKKHNHDLEILFPESDIDVSNNNSFKHLMTFDAIVLNKQLQISARFNTNYYTEDDIDLFSKILSDTINMINNHCANKERNFTPSDFTTVDISQEDIDKLFT